MQLSTAARNASLDGIVSAIGDAPTLKMWGGTMPSACDEPDTGTLVSTLVLADTWAEPASDGSVSFVRIDGDGIVTAALGAGTITYYRLLGSSGTCHAQGTVVGPGDTGDMVVSATTVAAGQLIVVNSWIITDGNG